MATQCSIEQCDKKHYALGLCNGHYQRKRAGKALDGVLTKRALRKDLPGYRGMHTRVDKARGKARIYFCVDCNSQADEWSLSPNAVDTLVSTSPHSAGKEYSLNVNDYEPRCFECHRKIDGFAFSDACRAARWPKAGSQEVTQ